MHPFFQGLLRIFLISGGRMSLNKFAMGTSTELIVKDPSRPFSVAEGRDYTGHKNGEQLLS